MGEYHKIQSIFKRDPATKYKTFLEGEYSEPVFEYLADNEWTFTEKVDGTNIRIYVTGDVIAQRVAGRTDRAQLPTPLLEWIDARDWTVPDLGEAVLYGEGYGPKIQSGGKYAGEQRFVLFDVRVGDVWLRRESVEDIAAHLGIEVVPIIGRGTLADAIEMTRNGFASRWGAFEAEGIVARPTVELLDRRGQRVITKVKVRDFR